MDRSTAQLALGAIAGAAVMLAAAQWLSWYRLSHTGQYVEELADTGWISNEHAWREHLEKLKQMEKLMAGDSRVYWQLGELQRWRAAGLRLWPDRQDDALRTARQRYFEALARSPQNGVLVARVAQRLAEMGDPRAVRLMRRAMAIAPHEPAAQYHVADVGMRYWPDLDAATRQEVAQLLRRAMDNYRLAPEVKKLAGRHEFPVQLDALETAQ